MEGSHFFTWLFLAVFLGFVSLFLLEGCVGRDIENPPGSLEWTGG
jgi:hypothetical protein